MKIILVLLLLSGLQLVAQASDEDMQSCPMHKQHMKTAPHQADVEKNGDMAMGFPHESTAHHFRLYSNGGAIEVTANDNQDSRNIEAIQAHLAHIAKMFSTGDFSIPMFVHSEMPPGVSILKEKQKQISYSFEKLPNGGAVHIKTSDLDALNAVHDFLRFQIEDHQTGDTTDVAGEL
jgi:hypothetical protein